jgi:hypothetical protein
MFQFLRNSVNFGGLEVMLFSWSCWNSSDDRQIDRNLYRLKYGNVLGSKAVCQVYCLTPTLIVLDVRTPSEIT